MKRALFLVLAFLLAVPAGGCLKTNTVDESGYVLAIGFDPGETFAYRVSFAVQKISTGSSEPSTDGFMLFSAEAENLFQAIETVSANAPYQLSFVRTAMLFFDQKLLEDAGRLSSIMNTAMERLRIRYNANVFVALDGAKKVLEGLNSQESPQSIDKLQEHFLAYARDTGMLPEVTFLMLYQGIRQPTSDAVIPLMGTNEDIRRLGTADSVGETDYAYLGGRTATQTQLQTGVAGLGLMEADRLVGILSGQNTQLLLMATGDFQTGDMQLPLPDGSGMATAAVRMQRAPKTELALSEPPAALVRIHLEADLLHPEILGNTSNEELEAHFAHLLEQRLQAVFLTCRALGSDAFGFGKLAVKKFSSVSEWEAYDWKARFQGLEARFEVSVVIQDYASRKLFQ